MHLTSTATRTDAASGPLASLLMQLRDTLVGALGVMEEDAAARWLLQLQHPLPYAVRGREKASKWREERASCMEWERPTCMQCVSGAVMRLL